MKYNITFLVFFSFLCFSFAQTPACDLIEEDLEGHFTNTPPENWVIDGGYINGGDANSGTRKAGLNDTGDKIIVAPVICPGEICFFWRASGAGSNFDVDIEWSQDNGMTWEIAHTIALNGNNSPTTYAELCVDLPEEMYTSATTEVLIRFHQGRRSGGSLYLDDICVRSGTCSSTPELIFQNLPVVCVVANSVFSITVCADDGAGGIDNSFSETITLSKNSGIGNLNGGSTQTAMNGCAQFSGLSFDAADTYTLLATSLSLTGISSDMVIQDACVTQETLTIMAYNVLNYPNGAGCEDNLTVPDRADTLRKIVEHVQPDVLMIVELQNEAGADLILNDALNVNGITDYQRADFVSDQSGGGGGLNNMFFYRSDKMTLKKQDEIQTNLRDIGMYTVFMNDPNLSAHEDTTFIDFYTAHLKAGTGTENENKRALTATAFQNHMNSQAAARYAIIGGDFNLYTSDEVAYQTLLSGTYPFFDPIDTPGDWASFNFNDKSVHTQATRDQNETMTLDCGARGGMDDRFDFLLVSGSIMSGMQRVRYLENTYEALGNNGSVHNDAINDPTNTSSVPNTILEALYHMSDHLPVVMDIEVDYPTPVVLALDALGLRAKTDMEGVQVDWQSNIFNEISPWILEKSTDGRTFELLVELAAATTDFYDENPYGGANYYRLKQMDRNGEIQYSNIVLAKYYGQKISVFPNPVERTLHFYNITFEKERTLNVYNTIGQLVEVFSISKNQSSIAVANLPTGSYFIKIEGGDWVGRFLKL